MDVHIHIVLRASLAKVAIRVCILLFVSIAHCPCPVGVTSPTLGLAVYKYECIHMQIQRIGRLCYKDMFVGFSWARFASSGPLPFV